MHISPTAKVKKRAPRRKPSYPPEIGLIIRAITEKKGEHIVSIDLRKAEDAVCDFFVIADASSSTQVRGIAENISRTLELETGEKPWHTEGLQHLEWVLMDYVNIVVHVFQKQVRSFYQLEELWSDGVLVEHND